MKSTLVDPTISAFDKDLTVILLFLIFRPHLILNSFLLHPISGDHSLPDVTASTGIKVANKFSNDNVMMQVRGGHFK